MWVQKVTGGGIDGVAYPDGRTLLTADAIGRFTAWDLATHTQRRLTQLAPLERIGLHHLLVSPDGQFLVALQPGTSVAVPIESGRCWQHDRLSVPYTSAARFAPGPVPPEARFGPAGSPVLVTLTADRTQLNWYDLSARSEAQTPLPTQSDLPAHSFDFSPDGRTIAVVGNSGEVTLADVESNAVRARIKVPDPSWFVYVQSAPARFAPDGNTLLLFSEQRLVVWDVARGAARAETRDLISFRRVFALNPVAPVFAALNRDLVLTLYSLDTARPLRSLDFALGRQVRCVAFSPDGLTCAVGGSNKQFGVFDVDV